MNKGLMGALALAGVLALVPTHAGRVRAPNVKASKRKRATKRRRQLSKAGRRNARRR